MYEEVTKLPDYEVAFVWNRTDDKMKGVVPDQLILQDLSDFSSRYRTHMANTLSPFLLTEPFVLGQLT